MPEAPTRERLVTEAMRLFGEQGYQATSVAQIEAAAGLAPGSGALYHHFKSKEELLGAGVDRQLDRRSAMRDIRSLFAGLGDLRIELTMLGRYVLTVLDDETQMLRVASQVPADLSKRLTAAYGALFEGLYAELADWVRGWVPDLTKRDAAAVAAVGDSDAHRPDRSAARSQLAAPSALAVVLEAVRQPAAAHPANMLLAQWGERLGDSVHVVVDRPRIVGDPHFSAYRGDAQRQPGKKDVILGDRHAPSGVLR
jgi:AcrR family transcriptional regulator